MLSEKELLRRLEKLEREIQDLKTHVADKASGARAPTSLYGLWKGKFSPDVDVDQVLSEIRTAWTRRLDQPQ